MRRPAVSRLLALTGLSLAPLALLAATGGPDDGDMIYTDSAEADGPSHQTFTLDDATSLGLGDDETTTVSLPFDFTFYGTEYSEVDVSSNGAFFFSGATTAAGSICPGDGGATWVGAAPYWDDLAAGTVQHQTFGRYPYRAFVIDWEAEHASVSGGSSANFQAWLLEGRSEVVFAYKDLTFGDAAYDEGANAVIGTYGSTSGSSLSYVCTGVVTAGTSVWMGDQSERPASATRDASDLSLSWTGEDVRQYIGRSLGLGDLNADGYSDLAIGNQDDDQVLVFLGERQHAAETSSEADITISGSSGDETGTAVLIADLDGDGYGDLAVGSPLDDSMSVDDGAVYIFSGDGLGGSLSVGSDEDLHIESPTSAYSSIEKKKTGAALATGDFDGDGYTDLLIGAPGEDPGASNAGAAYVYLGGASIFASAAVSLDDYHVHLKGVSTTDRAGTAVAAGDFDNDGADDIVVAAPYADPTATGAGSVYGVFGGALSGSLDLSTDADFQVDGDAGSDYLGIAMATGDVDGDGAEDLLLGASGADPSAGSNAGIGYLFMGVSTMSGTYAASDAHMLVNGTTASMQAGASVALEDLDEDGSADIIVGAPNDNSQVSGGGSVAVFKAASLTSATTSIDYTDADHILYGSKTSGALGTALVVGEDLQGDGYSELIASAPYADANGSTGAGAVYLWSFLPDFLDADADGFVSVEVGGTDCDDSDSAVNADASETSGNVTDDDCDGWIDDMVILRGNQDHWEYDLEEELGAASSVIESFDFETGTSGSSAATLYQSDGLTITADGSEVVTTTVWGAVPRDSLGLRVTAGSSNAVTLDFGDDVQGVAFYVLDGDSSFSFDADHDGSSVISSVPFDADGPDKAGGTLIAMSFAEVIDSLTLTGTSSDAFGLDDIMIVWADDTDGDGDGYTDNDGDCDDEDADVNPGATEVLGNGKDDDCDGTTDGGSLSTYTDYSTWSSDAGLDEELIDFEDLSSGETVDDDYEDLGVSFDGSLDVTTDVDGSAPVDTQGAECSTSTLTITFDELQPAVAITVLDGAGDFHFTGSASGTSLYTWTASLGAEDTAEGSFSGAVFDYGIDTLEIENDSSSDAWGIDDLVFHVLGLDDADGDGYTESEGDCDDDDASANPDETEVWYDGTDSDCDGESDYDADGDGHDSDAYGGTDCDDEESATNPDATETWYDGTDSDCDGWSDYDADLDGHDDEAYGGTDCDDTSSEISPDASETWYDGTDDNCDPTDDDDADGDGFSLSGTSTGSSGGGDCDDTDASVNPDATETWYDGTDQDCDEASDYDADSDGYDDEAYGGTDCDDTTDTVYPGASGETCYDGVDTDCDDASDYDCDGDGYDSSTYSSSGTDCDDTDSSIYPGASDTWGDGIDSDCDGAKEFDNDGDGYDDADRGGDDCDDSDSSINPGATEIWYDGTDQDCDEASDYDADSDGYDSDAYSGTDCDDADPSINPGATDYYYDGTDTDCDGSSDYDADGDGEEASWYGGTDCDDTDADVNTGATETWYDGTDADCDGLSDYDADGDGYDSADELSTGTDCDDTDASVHPYAAEIAGDGTDQNCDGLDASDADEDGWTSDVDCDDGDPDVNPGATEVCYDGTDSDCDAASDYDCDGDGQDSDAYGGDDCDDTDASTYLGAPEIWYDGVDGDCSGGDDFDKDGDGETPVGVGGTDCDDADAETNSAVSSDDCGGGDNDCDGEVDEDCATADDGADDGGADDGSDDGSGDGSDDGSDDGGADEGSGTGDDTGGGDSGAGSGSGSGDDGYVDPNEGFSPPAGGQSDDGVLEGCGTGDGCGGGGSSGALALFGLLGLGALRRRRD